MKSLLKLLPYLREHRGKLILSLVCSVFVAAANLSPMILFQKLVDDLLVSKDPRKLALYPFLVIGIFGLNFIFRFFQSFLLRLTVARVNQRLKNDLYDHVMGLSADYFTTQSTGMLISRVGNDPNVIDQGISQSVVAIREPITLLGALAYILYLDWKLTAITLLIAPPMAFVFSFSGKALKRYIHRMADEQGHLYSSLQESFTGIRMIKAFRLERFTQAKFRERSENYTRTFIKTIRLEDFSHPLIQFITAFAIAGILYFGVRRVFEGHLTSGQLMSFFVAFAVMLNPLRTLNDMNIKLNTAGGACERVFEVLAWKTHLHEPGVPETMHPFARDIVFDRVRFAYPDAPEREVLKGISFSVTRGHSVALVGASGAGKSSLVSLLPRIFDVTGGTIRIDGHDIRGVKLDELRSQIAVVSQDVFLFNDTIASNIRCGKLDATDAEIRDAARHAHALDFIESLPDGFATVIGDRGQKLSGGERQRLSIARAFLRQAPILILDEATSSLDSASEKAVQEALEELMHNRTTILIAHRLSTIRHADQIHVLRQGEIVESGSHDELLARDGEYAQYLRLSQHQQGAAT